MSNIIDSIQLSGVTYQIQGSGGDGKAIEAGRGISVTTGETADTVSFDLPISAGTGSNSIAEGSGTIASGNYSHAEGAGTTASGFYSHAEGGSTIASGFYSHAEGYHTTASGFYSHTEGRETQANNNYEHASGHFNVSSSASTTFGDSGNTLFSVGNGTGINTRHNAFEIRQNGDIYLSSGGTDILLQDHLGGGGTVDQTIISGSTNAVAGGAVYNKIDEVEEVTAAGLNALNDKITPTVELTQAQYDALVSAGTVAQDTYYIITDATPIDITNYYTKTETNTLLGGKQATLVSSQNIKTINNESILGSGNIDIQGGGKAVSGGTNISITTGETADTINCTLPMSTDSVKKIVVNSNYSSFVTSDAVFTANSLSNSILLGNNTFNIKGIIKGKINNNLIIGSYNTSNLTNGTKPTLEGNLVVGSNNAINSSYSLLVGNNNTISRSYQFAVGYKQHPNNDYETSLGNYNVSSSGSSTFGDSGNTLFSVGNGTSESARHNAFEIRQNGDIYLTLDGQDVKLQDQLGGSSITVDSALSSTSENPVQNKVIYNKIDEIEQVTAAGLNAVNDALGGLKLVKLTQAEYNALATKDSSTLYIIVN